MCIPYFLGYKKLQKLQELDALPANNNQKVYLKNLRENFIIDLAADHPTKEQHILENMHNGFTTLSTKNNL